MWFFDIVTNTWTLANDGTGTAPAERASVTMVLDTSRDRTWIYGGTLGGWDFFVGISWGFDGDFA